MKTKTWHQNLDATKGKFRGKLITLNAYIFKKSKINYLNFYLRKLEKKIQSKPKKKKKEKGHGKRTMLFRIREGCIEEVVFELYLERWRGVFPRRKERKLFQAKEKAISIYEHLKASRVVRKSHVGSERKVSGDESVE